MSVANALSMALLTYPGFTTTCAHLWSSMQL
jgi:hypothetical protein